MTAEDARKLLCDAHDSFMGQFLASFFETLVIPTFSRGVATIGAIVPMTVDEFNPANTRCLAMTDSTLIDAIKHQLESLGYKADVERAHHDDHDGFKGIRVRLEFARINT